MTELQRQFNDLMEVAGEEKIQMLFASERDRRPITAPSRRGVARHGQQMKGVQRFSGGVIRRE